VRGGNFTGFYYPGSALMQFSDASERSYAGLLSCLHRLLAYTHLNFAGGERRSQRLHNYVDCDNERDNLMEKRKRIASV